MGKKSLKSHDAETEPVFIDLVDPPLPNKGPPFPFLCFFRFQCFPFFPFPPLFIY
uniref:Uncharacterized protein n=1 Tax=Rhizophora mucronata TaxID=61149 RepID=A0A2P2JAA5_RHIMU